MISDPTANWTDYIQKTSGTTVLDQDRDHNHVNEIDTDDTHGDADNPITETTGTAWADPVHDAAGNMTTVPKPKDLANGLTLTYDAWNRLVEVEDDEAEVTVAKYEYDGVNRRIKKHIDSQSPGSPDRIDRYEHFFYNTRWQTLETRDTTTENDGPESLQTVRTTPSLATDIILANLAVRRDADTKRVWTVASGKTSADVGLMFSAHRLEKRKASVTVFWSRPTKRDPSRRDSAHADKRKRTFRKGGMTGPFPIYPYLFWDVSEFDPKTGREPGDPIHARRPSDEGG